MELLYIFLLGTFMLFYYFLTFEFDIVNNKFGNITINDVINKGRKVFGPVIHFPLKKK